MNKTIITICILPIALIQSASQAQSSIRVERATVLLDRKLEVPARETGVLSKIVVKPGMTIRSGDLLGQMDDLEATLALTKASLDRSIAEEEAENDVDILAAKKSLEVARAELKRSEEAVAIVKTVVSQTELDKLKLDVERAELAVKQAEKTQRTARLRLKLAENEVKQAKRVVDRHKIKSSLTGIVDQISREEGEWVKPGDPVFRVLQLDRLRCEGFVDASRLRGKVQGRKVRLTVYLDEKLTKTIEVMGELVFVGSEINSIKGDVRVRAEFENKDLTIRPGMNATMEILMNEPLAKANETTKN